MFPDLADEHVDYLDLGLVIDAAGVDRRHDRFLREHPSWASREGEHDEELFIGEMNMLAVDPHRMGGEIHLELRPFARALDIFVESTLVAAHCRSK